LHHAAGDVIPENTKPKWTKIKVPWGRAQKSRARMLDFGGGKKRRGLHSDQGKKGNSKVTARPENQVRSTQKIGEKTEKGI